MLARLVFGLVLGLLMYVPRPIPRPPIDPPPTPEDVPPGDGDTPPSEPPTLPPGGGKKKKPGPIGPPSLPPTPPPGYEGEWPPKGERPDGPSTPPREPDVPWLPRPFIDFAERVHEMITRINTLVRERPEVIIAGTSQADEGAKRVGEAIRRESPGDS